MTALCGNQRRSKFFNCLSQAASNQNYHPEWVITGLALTDTTFFGRTYDKTQWKNAFGVSLLAARAGKEKADADRFEGTWVVDSASKGGEQLPEELKNNFKITFQGKKLIVDILGMQKEGTFKVDPKKSPKQLNITTKNKTLHGIYQVKGDELKLCFENGGQAENRPRKFATNKEEELVLIVFKRQKP